jgi:hypothetical protein
MKPKLSRILKAIAKDSLSVQPPCPARELKALRRRLKATLGLDLPAEYEELLSLRNGIDYNGTLIFAAATTPYAGRPGKFIEGLVEANEIRRERAEHLLIFGESGMEMYALDLETGRFVVADDVSLDVYEDYGSFDRLMIAALEKRLD